MIVTLTPNPAIDMTYQVSALALGEPHAVTRVRERAGGKGVNAAAVLTTLDIETIALCPIGDDDQTVFAADLDRRGIGHALVPVPGRVRRSIAVVEPDGRATVFNEPGTAWPGEAMGARLEQYANTATVVAVCGSVPPGTEAAVLAAIRTAGARGARLLLDLRGEVLRESLALNPDLVKPNRAEAAATLGLDPKAAPPAAELAGRLVAQGAQAAVVSDGNRGVALATAGLRLRACLPERLSGNATGAGDALTAALAPHVAHDPIHWPDALRDGVACSAAAVLQPVAGQVDPDDVARLRPRVVIKEESA